MPKLPTQRSRARSLDQFYTLPAVATACSIALVEVMSARGVAPEACFFVEPSAGAGAFLPPLAGFPHLALDIDPHNPNVIEVDFIESGAALAVAAAAGRPCVVVGNPPFGKNASLALRFVNHAATFADWVAFILPRTFEKSLFQDRVHPRLHLELSVPLEKESFTHAGQPYAVPVVFQVWRRRDGDRARAASSSMTHRDFAFVADSSAAAFAFQRVGAAAGKVSTEGLEKSWRSHYFIQPRKGCPRDVRTILASIDWTAVKHRTAGNPSIGKRELVAAYAHAVGEAP